MPVGKITKRAVDAANPDGRDAYLWDSELTGYGLKVTPGGTRVYLVQYRLGGRRGRTRRVTIGKHGSPWTPETARKEAKRLLGEVAAGRDPAEEKAKARDDMTVDELCDLYLAEGCSTKKPSTLSVDRGRIERHIKPLLGRKRARSVTRSDVERLLRDVAAGKTARVEKTRPRGRANVRGGKGTANRTVSLLSAIFSFAVGRGIRSDNPALRIKRYPGTRHERFLTPSELAALGDVLDVAEKGDENPVAIAAIRLLTLTGCRKSEISAFGGQRSIGTETACDCPTPRRGPGSFHLAPPRSSS